MLALRPAVLEQPEPADLGDSSATGLHVHLAQDRRDVVVDRARREEQPFRDCRVAEPVGEEP